MRVPLGAAWLERWLNPAWTRQEPRLCFFSRSPLRSTRPAKNILTMPVMSTRWWKEAVREGVSVLLFDHFSYVNKELWVSKQAKRAQILVRRFPSYTQKLQNNRNKKCFTLKKGQLCLPKLNPFNVFKHSIHILFIDSLNITNANCCTV